MTPKQHLISLSIEANRIKYPSLPEAARVIPIYTDNNTNGLTKMVYIYLILLGFHCERTNNMGRPVDNSKIVENCIGQKHKIGSMQWIRGSGKKGTSDLKAIVNGKFLAIEIKCKATNDRQSDAQKIYQKEVEKSGGIYYIAKDFDSFYEFINKLIQVI